MEKKKVIESLVELTEDEIKEFKIVEKQLIKDALKKDEDVLEICGMKLKIIKGVFHPGVFECGTDVMMNFMSVEKAKSFFDMGTGCGIFALYAKKKGVKKVWASDIRKEAVSCAKKNSKDLKLDITVEHSDLFNKIDIKKCGKFDIIWWHHPYGRTEGNEDYGSYLTNLLDKDYILLLRFLKDSQKYLETNGVIYVPNGKQIGDRKLFLKRVNEANLNYEIIGSVDDGEFVKGKRFTTEVFKLFPKKKK